MSITALSCGRDEAAAPRCGDDVVDPGEVCDGAYAGEGLGCSDFGFIRGDLRCSDDCLRPVTDACVSGSDKPSACGDHVLDPGEECDGVLPPMMDCTRLGLPAGELVCSESCVIDSSGCGRGGEGDGSPAPAGCQACGSSGVRGDPFCMGNDLYLLYEEIGCDKGQCTSSTAPKLQKTCAMGCKDGACVECSPIHATYACDGADVYWYDGCGSPSGLKEDCGAGTCEGGSCVACHSGDLEEQGCDPGTYCPSGSRARACIDHTWSSWGACEADGPRYYGDGGERCGPVLCLTASSSGADSSVKAKLTKNGGGTFDNDVDLVLYAPSTGDQVFYGCMPTAQSSEYEIFVPMSEFQIDVGETLEVNAQIFSPCNNGGSYVSGDVSISRCSL